MSRVLCVTVIALVPLAAWTRQGTRQPGSDLIHVEVTDRGFVPAEVVVPKGKPVTLVATRKTDQTMVVGVLTSFILELVVYPAIFAAWRSRGLPVTKLQGQTEGSLS